MKFEKLRLEASILRALEDLGFKKTTDIQYKAIRSALTGSDILAVAQTGTGKTAAYLIPTIQKILESPKLRSNVPGVLILVPTRELALQVNDVIISLVKYTKLRTVAIYGGSEQDQQIQTLNKGVDFVVCTPGRMFDLRSQGALNLEKIHTLIIDEADQMLKLGFYKDVMDILKYIPFYRQTLFFSATIDTEIKKLAYSLVNKPIRIELSPKNPISKNISHCVMHVEMDDKRFFLERLIRENSSSKIIVFVRTQVRADRVQAAMKRVEIPTAIIHGGLEQEKRNEAIEQLKSGDLRILIATDVSARGIDIPNVDLVVNYDVPDVAENYVHRIGRTGRGVAKGLAYTFVAESEKELLAAIEAYITEKIPQVDLDKNTYEEIKKIADPNNVSMTEIENMINEFDKEADSWAKSRKRKKG
ncbi:MAG TPA: DEAD/DEAH box helicase [Saprospiraceae bacterium]|nr:DEAD/DEAH box helicase [Saprospiraceae bacterium]